MINIVVKKTNTNWLENYFSKMFPIVLNQVMSKLLYQGSACLKVRRVYALASVGNSFPQQIL